MNKTPIGVFDSGYGGLTILQELQKVLPNYDFLYLGDNARNPYGTRSYEVVYQYTLESVEFLFKKNCPLIILACNTASAKALRTIQQNDIERLNENNRVLGVIRPTVEYVGKITQTGSVGVLGTTGTVNSNSYPIELSKWTNGKVKVVHQQACPLWVPIVENNEIETEGANFFIRRDINNLLTQDAQIDTIILGCTHYPLLLESIIKYIPKEIKLVTQGEIVADKLIDYLNRHPEMDQRISKNGITKYLTTESSVNFDENASRFLNSDVQSIQVQY